MDDKDPQTVIDESIARCRKLSNEFQRERQKEIDRDNHIRKHGPWWKKFRLWILDNVSLP